MAMRKLINNTNNLYMMKQLYVYLYVDGYEYTVDKLILRQQMSVVKGARCKVQGARCRVQGAGCRVQYDIYNPRC